MHLENVVHTLIKMITIEFIVLLCILQLANSLQDALTCIEPSFTCNIYDKSVAYLKGSNKVIKCDPGKQCNSENLMPCDPCIEISLKCGNTFYCIENDLSKFHTKAGEFECEENYVCNAKYEHHCEPCVKKTCKSQFPWTCITENVFIMNDYFRKCDQGTFCNKYNSFPCTPCIKSHNEHARKILTINK